QMFYCPVVAEAGSDGFARLGHQELDVVGLAAHRCRAAKLSRRRVAPIGDGLDIFQPVALAALTKKPLGGHGRHGLRARELFHRTPRSDTTSPATGLAR